MIHEIGVELRTALLGQGCPIIVVDGPENTDTTTFGRERIVIEYDESGKDRFTSVKGTHVNPQQRFTTTMACKLTIYAQAKGLSGALNFEHRRRGRHVLDIVLVALAHIASVRKNAWAPGAGGFVTPPDLKGTEREAGAVYELAFTFDRGVAELTWASEKRPEAAIGGFSNTTNVTGPGAGDPEVGCGT